jgi:anti-sigma factor RsiW
MTGRIISLQSERHRQVQSLLPWYLTGRLDEAERAGVSAHLAQCAECQAELAADRHLADGLMGLAEPPVPRLDVEHGWAAMRRRLDEAEPDGAPLAGLGGWLGRARRAVRIQWRSGEPWMRWALVGQACLLLVLGGVVLQTGQPARYRALGAEPPPAAANMVVIFRPETRERELRALLGANHARLVGGPTEAGAYMLQVPAPERAAALARMRGQVVLAEPIDPGAPN